MKQNYCLSELQDIEIKLKKPCIIFFYGDLGAWKTTLSQVILSRIVWKRDFASPTYVYYNKYDENYHFDLYRLTDYDEFVSIWGEEILDNNTGVVLIEWPQLLEWVYKPDIEIHLEKWVDETSRDIEIIYM